MSSFGYNILGFGSNTTAGGIGVDYLVIAGGGSGGAPNGGGGGAGGMRFSAYGPSPLNSGVQLTIQPGTTYAVVVGGGGPPQSYPSPQSQDRGGTSSFNAPGTEGVDAISSTGGGTDSPASKRPGGSGSGSVGWCGVPGGDGNTPPTSPPQGNPGGIGQGGGSAGSSGGGGAGEAGQPGQGSPDPDKGRGGNGVAINITGTVSNQNAILVQLKNAIDHANGHNAGSAGSKIVVSNPATAAVPALLPAPPGAVVWGVGLTVGCSMFPPPPDPPVLPSWVP